MEITHNKKVIEHYRETASLYNFFCNFKDSHSLHYGFYDDNHRSRIHSSENAINTLALLAKIKSSDSVLDAGCGMGVSSIWLAKNKKARVTGINISPYQLEIARKLAERNQVKNLVNFFERDYCDSKFQDGFFDVVWAQDSVCHAVSKEVFVKESYRVLKPGGRLIVCDGFLTKPRHTLNWFLLKFLELFEKGFVLGKLISVYEFKTFIIKAGFRRVKVYDKTKAAHPDFVRAFFVSLIFYIPLFILEKLRLTHPMMTRLALTGIIQLPGEILKFGKYKIFIAEKVSPS